MLMIDKAISIRLSLKKKLQEHSLSKLMVLFMISQRYNIQFPHQWKTTKEIQKTLSAYDKSGFSQRENELVYKQQGIWYQDDQLIPVAQNCLGFSTSVHKNYSKICKRRKIINLTTLKYENVFNKRYKTYYTQKLYMNIHGHMIHTSQKVGTT